MATRTHCAHIATVLRWQNISPCALLINRPSYGTYVKLHTYRGAQFLHLSSLSTPILGPSCPVVELNLVFILTAISFRRVLFCICPMYINYTLYHSISISGGPWQPYSDLNSPSRPTTSLTSDLFNRTVIMLPSRPMTSRSLFFIPL